MKIPGGSDIGSSSDDCLNLSIFIPIDVSGQLPFMVRIHDGSNFMCSNKGDFEGFTNTASQHGVYCTSINYWHSYHGFFHFPEVVVSNLSLKDVICELEWIQNNNDEFRGNLTNATITWQSVGGVAVANWLGYPRASGLFQRCIVQSGGMSIWSQETHATHVVEDCKHVMKSLLKSNGCSLMILPLLHRNLLLLHNYYLWAVKFETNDK